jgi:hypothetical protein
LEPQNEENNTRVPHYREQPVLLDDEKTTFSRFRENVLSNWNEISQPASLIWNNLGMAGSIFCDIAAAEGRDIARNASMIWNNGQLAWSAVCEIPGAYAADRMNLLYHKPIDGILTIATDVLPLFSIGGTIVGKTTSVTEILSEQTAKKAPIILSSAPKRLLWSTKEADASFGYNSAVKPWVASVGKSSSVVQNWTPQSIIRATATENQAAGVMLYKNNKGKQCAEITISTPSGFGVDRKIKLLQDRAGRGHIVAGMKQTNRNLKLTDQQRKSYEAIANGYRVTDPVKADRMLKMLNTCDVDHLIDLQVGGLDSWYNLGLTGRSANRSIGKSLELRMKELPIGTIIEKINFIKR